MAGRSADWVGLNNVGRVSYCFGYVVSKPMACTFLSVGKKNTFAKAFVSKQLVFCGTTMFLKKKASTLDSGISRGFQNVLLVTFKNVSEVLLSSTVLISLQFLRFC